MSNPPWVLPVHSTSGTKGAASIVIGEVGGVSGTSTRGGSGVLSMTVSGDILNGDGRSQYTGVNVFPGDSGGVGGGVANWPSQPWSCRTHGVYSPPPLMRSESPSGESSAIVRRRIAVRGVVGAVAVTNARIASCGP
jgi:hypothetical protein